MAKVEKPRVIVAFSGASGPDYALRILEMLAEAGVESHFIMSRSAKVSLAHESDRKIRDFEDRATRVYDNADLTAPISSGSFLTDGMIIAPCSAKTLGEIAAGIGGTLIARAADVVLKERRRLVLMFRETPLNLIHCRNMTTVTEAGGIVMPPVPAFYPRPKTVQDIVDHTAARALDLLGLHRSDVRRWKDS
ncbi:MAG: UbiX family flavin prenyltransferase [Rhodobacteraceae bacterium]|jgi:4-hydroxy-3-polyprenylbenzoate decarboxylase|nr:UbiX family flavin prenyltransferase [Paracoccaceae bacterium]